MVSWGVVFEVVSKVFIAFLVDSEVAWWTQCGPSKNACWLFLVVVVLCSHWQCLLVVHCLFVLVLQAGVDPVHIMLSGAFFCLVHCRRACPCTAASVTDASTYIMDGAIHWWVLAMAGHVEVACSWSCLGFGEIGCVRVNAEYHVTGCVAYLASGWVAASWVVVYRLA